MRSKSTIVVFFFATLFYANCVLASIRSEDSHFGFTQIFTTLTDGTTTCVLDSYTTLAATNAGWVRPHPGPAVWGKIQTSPASLPSGYHWSDLDGEVTTAQDNGFNILLTVFPYADWDQVSCNSTLLSLGITFDPSFMDILMNYRQNPCNSTSYGYFLGNLVERYDYDSAGDMPGLQGPIAYYEVNNEPSIQSASTSNSEFFYYGDASQYAAQLIYSYNALNGAGVNVLNGGTYSIDSHVQTYWDDVLNAYSADGYFDIFSYHKITGTDADPDSEIPAVKTFLSTYSSSYNTSAYPIWETELEFSRDDYKTTSGGTVTYPTADEAASIVLEVYAQTFSAGAEKIFMAGPEYDQSYDLCGIVSPSYTNPFAMIDTLGTETEVFTAFSTMVAKIDFFTAVTEAYDVYEFTVGGNPVYLVPRSVDPTSALSSAGYSGTDTVTVTDQDGTVTTGALWDTLGTTNYVRFIE